MKRRRLLGLAAGLAATSRPRLATAQQAPSAARRLGVLSPQSATTGASVVAALRQGLRELGWQDGVNLAVETRYADGAIDRLPALAHELVARNVDVIVAGSNPGVQAARQATATIPIVMVTTGDPVVGALVASLARPGGNVTGVTTAAQELSGKRLELLREMMPDIRRVALLVNPDSPFTALYAREVVAAAGTSGIDLQLLEARDPREIEAAFARMRANQAQAVLVVADIMFITRRALITALALANRLPAVYWERTFVDSGGLMFYGASLHRMYRHAATHVDKILKGARPAELPVEQPTEFELVINLATAKALGIAIPQAMLLRADEVIE
jgi:putative ABC transport system substrate-binding protein